MSRGCREILSAAGMAGSKECAERDLEAEGGAEEAGPDRKRCTVSLEVELWVRDVPAHFSDVFRCE